jgi:hypothetical protein
MILSAYHTGSDAKASIFWSWWTMSYRVSEPCTQKALLLTGFRPSMLVRYARSWLFANLGHSSPSDVS